MRFSSAATALQEHLKAASSCFANTEHLNEQDWFSSRNDLFTYKNSPGDTTHANTI